MYVRVSSDDQVEGYSLSQQIEACQNFAKAREWEVVEVFVEEGESAFRDGLKRPKLREMFSRVEPEDVEHIIVWKFSRFARSSEEHHALQSVLAKDGARCVSVTEQVEDNAAGHMLEGIIASVNQYSSEQSGETIRANLQKKVEGGGYPNLAPIGYKNVRLEAKPGQRRGDAVIVPDEVQGPMVSEAFSLYASGEWSITTLMEEMNRRGLRNKQGRLVSRDTFHKMLRSPAYVGLIPYQGAVYDGSHDPIVERKTWEKVQAVADRNGKGFKRGWKHNHYLKGLLWCSCGGRLWFQIAKGRSDHYSYFYCSKRCGASYAPAPDLEEQVVSLYEEFRLPEDFRAHVRLRLERAITEREKGRASKIQWLSKRLEKLAREREKLMTAYYAEAIDTEMLKREQERIRRGISDMETQLEAATADLREQTKSIELAMELLGAMHDLYTKASEEIRGKFNKALFDRIVVEEKSVTGFTLNEPFRQLLEPEAVQTSEFLWRWTDLNRRPPGCKPRSGGQAATGNLSKTLLLPDFSPVTSLRRLACFRVLLCPICVQ